MAASMGRRCLRGIFNVYRRTSRHLAVKMPLRVITGTGLLTSPMLMKLSAEGNPQLEEPDSTTLSREYKIKSSLNSTASHVGDLLVQTALALKDTHKEYAEAVAALVVLMEYKLQILGNQGEEERIWDIILEARGLVNSLKLKKTQLESTLASARGLLNATAELAYLLGEDLVGGCACDQLNKVEMFVNVAQRDSEEAETMLRKAEAKSVEVEGKYAEELKKKAELEKEKIKDKDDNDDDKDYSDVDLYANTGKNET